MTGALRVDVRTARRLRFDDGAPVRAASGIAPFEDGWLVVSDDATHVALWTTDGIARLRVLPPVEGHDVFDEESGTKHLKPDLEAACGVVDVEGARSALLLGSGSLSTRMRAVLVEERTRQRRAADLRSLYQRVAAVLNVPPDQLNLEAACVLAGSLRWFQRGNRRLGIPSASVDVDLTGLLVAIRGEAPVEAVPVRSPQAYEFDAIDGRSLGVTDAIALPDGRVLLAAVGEDTPNAVDDGPVVDAALVLLDGGRVVASARLRHGPQGPDKVEGVALAGLAERTAHLIAVVDADDPAAPSLALELAVALP